MKFNLEHSEAMLEFKWDRRKERNSWVSSAQRWWFRQQEEMRVLRGVVYMTKSSGPRTEPWGTPQEDVYQEDKLVSHLTRKQRYDRYDLNQLRTEPWMPNQDERRVIKMSWSTVSKATESSSRQRHDTFCDPTVLTRWSWMYKRAVSVEWYLQ